jgi:uridine kinase
VPENCAGTGKKKTQVDVEQLDTVDAAEPDHYGEEFDVKLERNPNTGEDEFVAIPHVLSFDQGFFHAIRAIELMRDKHPDRVVIVGVAGPPGSGKTTFARKMHELLGDSLVLPLETFVRVDSVIDGNFDDISLVEFDLVVKALTALKSGNEIEIPQVTIYSPELRKRTGFKRTAPPPSRVVLVEGSYALNPAIRPLLDITVAITGGVHLDLIKRILRDIHSANKKQKDVLLLVTNVMFPMYKAFIEPDLESAKIRIHSTYNPMAAMVDPIYSCKAKLADVEWDHTKFAAAIPAILGGQGSAQNKVVLTEARASLKQAGPVVVKDISDMYLAPPRATYEEGPKRGGKGRRNWIRIRRFEGLFYIHFYSEIMGNSCNTRPTVNFEISVKAISGLLSLGYEIGAILHRRTETWYDANGLQVTKESIKELEKDFVQVKGKNRKAVVALADQMKVSDHHIPHSFLQLYFRKLQKEKKDNSVAVSSAAVRSFADKTDP